MSQDHHTEDVASSGVQDAFAAAREAEREADRISFRDLGRRREEIARALPVGGDLAAALVADAAYQALIERRDALRREQVELEALAGAARTPCRSDAHGSGTSHAGAAAPKLRSDRPTDTRATRTHGQVPSGWMKTTLHVLVVIAVSAAIAAHVQESQVAHQVRASSTMRPRPDHVGCTGVWLHPALFDALRDEDPMPVFDDGHRLQDFLAEHGLSLSGTTPLVRIEHSESFDDPELQARFGMKYSYLPNGEDVPSILSTLAGANDGPSIIPGLRNAPLHSMDLAHLPKPLDVDTVLEAEAQRQQLDDPAD